MSPNTQLPRWADIGLIPLINVMAALFVAGIVIAIIGENPFDALLVMIKGALSIRARWIHPLLQPISSSPGWLWRWLSMRCCSISAGKVRPISAGWGGAGLPCP